MPLPPRLHKHNANILLKITTKKKNEIKKKTFHQFEEFIEYNPLIYNTLQFDQYWRLAICLNIFWFSVKISKANLKLKKKAFRMFVEFVKTKQLIQSTLQFDQYSRLTILFNIFRFLSKTSKTNFKFRKSFTLVCRTR